MTRYDDLATIAARQFGCWTLQQARDAGFPRQTVQALVARGAWERVHDGVFRGLGGGGRWASDLAAAWLFLGAHEAVVGRRAAARIWRLAGFERSRELAFVVPRGHTPRVPGVVVSRTIHLPPHDVVGHDGLRVTSVTRTLHDLARVVPIEPLTVAAAEAYRTGHTDPWRLLDAVRARPGLAGNGRLRAVIASLDPRMEAARSVAELVANLRLRELGLRDFDVNVRLTLRSGRRVEVDVLFPGRRVLEVNGARYHGSVIQRRADAERRADLVADGYVVRELWAGELHDLARVRAVVDDLLGPLREQLRPNIGTKVLTDVGQPAP